MPGGLFYFHVTKNGKPMTDEKVSAMRGKTKEAFHRVVVFHVNRHKPAEVTHFQVEMNDYGSLVDFTSSHPISEFAIPDLYATVSGARYAVTFDPFEGSDDSNNDHDNNNNKNGGARRRRTVKRRRSTRRKYTRRYHK
jgi:hypothetical protein